MIDAGEIRNIRRYLQSKLLDNSAWLDIVGRKITPSDIDLVVDNGGKVLFCELSRTCSEWQELERGQRWLYQSVLLDSIKCPRCSILLRHNVDCDNNAATINELRKINTITDIVSFQAMIFVWGEFRVSRVVDGNEHWQAFVKAWFRNSDGLRGSVFEKSTVIQTENPLLCAEMESVT
jgi:hypothetical protein